MSGAAPAAEAPELAAAVAAAASSAASAVSANMSLALEAAAQVPGWTRLTPQPVGHVHTVIAVSTVFSR